MEPANAPQLAHPLNGREILNVFRTVHQQHQLSSGQPRPKRQYPQRQQQRTAQEALGRAALAPGPHHPPQPNAPLQAAVAPRSQRCSGSKSTEGAPLASLCRLLSAQRRSRSPKKTRRRRRQRRRLVAGRVGVSRLEHTRCASTISPAAALARVGNAGISRAYWLRTRLDDVQALVALFSTWQRVPLRPDRAWALAYGPILLFNTCEQEF